MNNENTTMIPGDFDTKDEDDTKNKNRNNSNNTNTSKVMILLTITVTRIISEGTISFQTGRRRPSSRTAEF